MPDVAGWAGSKLHRAATGASSAGGLESVAANVPFPSNASVAEPNRNRRLRLAEPSFACSSLDGFPRAVMVKTALTFPPPGTAGSGTDWNQSWPSGQTKSPTVMVT